jgi:hypothetical protein
MLCILAILGNTMNPHVFWQIFAKIRDKWHKKIIIDKGMGFG